MITALKIDEFNATILYAAKLCYYTILNEANISRKTDWHSKMNWISPQGK